MTQQDSVSPEEDGTRRAGAGDSSHAPTMSSAETNSAAPEQVSADHGRDRLLAGAAASQAGEFAEALAIFTATAAESTGQLRWSAMVNAGTMADHLGDHDGAARWMLDALDEMGGSHPELRASALVHYSQALQHSGELDRAQMALTEARELLAAVAPGPVWVACLLSSTAVAIEREQWAAAIELAQDALEATARFAPELAGHPLMNLAAVYFETGRTELGLDFAGQALEAFEVAGDTQGVAETRQNLALMHIRLHQLDEAEPLVLAAQDYFERVGSAPRAGIGLKALGFLAERRGDLAGAYAHYRRCTEQFDSAGAYVEAADARVRLATAAFLLGRHSEAAQLLEHAFRVCAAHDLGHRCAQIDSWCAGLLETVLDDERPDPAIVWHGAGLAVTSALALDAVRFSFTDAAQRLRWEQQVAGPAQRLAFKFATLAGAAHLVAELVETQCAGSTIQPARPEPAPPRQLPLDLPDPRTTEPPPGTLALGVTLAAAVGTSGLRVSLPPLLRVGPPDRIALADQLTAAEGRYHVELRNHRVPPLNTSAELEQDGVAEPVGAELSYRTADDTDDTEIDSGAVVPGAGTSAEGAAAATPPTLMIRMADAGDLYVYWHWSGPVAEPGITAIPEDQVDAVVARVAAALPDPARPDGLESAFASSELIDPVAEAALAAELSRTLLPHLLAEQLYRFYTAGIRPLIRIQPSPRVAQIPWELMAPDPDVRMIDIADICQLAPAGLIHAPGRVQRSWHASAHLPRVAILDPRVPGFRADSALGSVLGRLDAESPLLQRVEQYRERELLRPVADSAARVFRREDLDREWLSATLCSGAARLLYVGHVTAAAPETGLSELARLHLACRDDTDGWAEPERTHRPLSARDLILGGPAGTPGDGPQRWPIPSRVALIACESGGDLRFGEPLGLVAAMLHGGAELVTAGRWALPTDLAYHRFAGAEPHAHPLQEAICAIDAAHEAADPVRALNDWQRERLAAWRSTGAAVDAPLLWAAFATISSPRPSAAPGT